MAGKRGRGEGSVTYDRRRKRYRARVTIGWETNEETGRTKQIVKTLGSNYKTKGEASEEERKYLNAVDENKMAPDSMTIGELWNKWMEFQDPQVRISTKNGYKHTEKYIRNLFNIKCINFNLKNYEEIYGNLFDEM